MKGLLLVWLILACQGETEIVNSGGQNPGKVNPDPEGTTCDPNIETCETTTVTVDPCEDVLTVNCSQEVIPAGSVDPNKCYGVSAWQQVDYRVSGKGNNRYPVFYLESQKRLYINVKDQQIVSAPIGADGTPGAFTLSDFVHGGIHGFAAIVAGGDAYMFRNGHIGKYPLDGEGNTAGGADDFIFYEDGGSTSFHGDKFVWDNAVYAEFGTGKYVLHLGGWDMADYGWKRNMYKGTLPFTENGTQFDKISGTEHPEGQPGQSAIYMVPGGNKAYVYASNRDHSKLHVLEINSQADPVGGWRELNPSGIESNDNGRGDLAVVGKNLLWVRGSKVNVMQIASDGGVSSALAWPDLPSKQTGIDWGGETDGSSWAIAQGNIYLVADENLYWSKLSESTCQ